MNNKFNILMINIVIFVDVIALFYSICGVLIKDDMLFLFNALFFIIIFIFLHGFKKDMEDDF